LGGDWRGDSYGCWSARLRTPRGLRKQFMLCSESRARREIPLLALLRSSRRLPNACRLVVTAQLYLWFVGARGLRSSSWPHARRLPRARYRRPYRHYTLVLSRLVGRSGKVIAFEPLEEKLRILQDNIRLNACLQVEAIREALWESSGQLELATQADDNESLPGRASAVTQLGEKRVSVEAVALDDSWAGRNERVDFIKIDVEGAQEQVLRGAERVIASGHPALLVELRHFHGSPEDSRVPSMLASLGYQVRWLEPARSTSHIAAIWKGHTGKG